MSGITTPSKEQIADAGRKAYNIAKANIEMLNEAGLFRWEHLKVFSVELIRPLSKELLNVPTMQATILAQGPDLTVGFIFMNALVFWFELLGSTFSFVLGRALMFFILEALYAYAVGYVLYWLVVHAVGKDYKLAAIGLYVLYSLVNIVQAVSSLVLILPPVFFFLKTCASLSCAYYAFKLREQTSGATQLADDADDEVELGVAE